jgi:hypothetical protein
MRSDLMVNGIKGFIDAECRDKTLIFDDFFAFENEDGDLVVPIIRNEDLQCFKDSEGNQLCIPDSIPVFILEPEE